MVVRESTVRLRDRGVVTLPKALRDRYGLGPGDTLHVVDLDGVFVVTPTVPTVPELVREIERLRTGAGLSTEDLLGGLRRERERYVQERYAPKRPDTQASRDSEPSGDSDGDPDADLAGGNG